MTALLRQNRSSHSLLSLHYNSTTCNVTRSKSYKDVAHSLHFGSLNEVVHVDLEKKTVLVEPRVTMEELVRATLPYGLAVPVIPEFKGITVGGAIMGGATESSGHKAGLVHDVCVSMEILCGDGSLQRVTPDQNPELFYGISGSYGSLGALVLAELTLVPVQEFVHVRYRVFSDPEQAIDHLGFLCHQKETPDFLDGIVFSKDCAVIIDGIMCSAASLPQSVPLFSQKSLTAEWYYHHVETIATSSSNTMYEEVMAFPEYVFRYDQGAFWMGTYLGRMPLCVRFLWEGVFHRKPICKEDIAEEIRQFHTAKSPNTLFRVLFHRVMSSQRLWSLFHKAEDFIQRRAIIQDFCIPECNAKLFLSDVFTHAGTFPLWLCPIRGTKTPQLLAPHLLPQGSSFSHFINIGIYGLPAYTESVEKITKTLEQKTQRYGGRKVLYTRSYYSLAGFWEIYPRAKYEALRMLTHAIGVWHDVTEKVLSK